MKTTIEISDSLLAEAKRLAREEGLTLRSLTEEGLSRVIAARKARPQAPPKPVTFAGNGLSREFQGTGWKAVREAAYEGHGG